LNKRAKCWIWCVNLGHDNLQWEVQEADENISQHQWSQVESDLYLLINTTSRFKASGIGSDSMGLCSLWSQRFSWWGTVSSVEERYSFHLKSMGWILSCLLHRQMGYIFLNIMIFPSHSACQICIPRSSRFLAFFVRILNAIWHRCFNSPFFTNCRYHSAVFKLTYLPCLMSEQLKYLAHSVPIKMKDKLVHFRVVYFLELLNSMSYLLPSIRWQKSC